MRLGKSLALLRKQAAAMPADIAMLEKGGQVVGLAAQNCFWQTLGSRHAICGQPNSE